jgi:hypothetical protein
MVGNIETLLDGQFSWRHPFLCLVFLAYNFFGTTSNTGKACDNYESTSFKVGSRTSMCRFLESSMIMELGNNTVLREVFSAKSLCCFTSVSWKPGNAETRKPREIASNRYTSYGVGTFNIFLNIHIWDISS